MLRALLAALILSACATLQAPPRVSAPDRLAAECALLAEAAQRMTAPQPGLSEGCPGTSERDTRPLAYQMASLRAAQAAPLPQGVTPQTRADTVFRRLITRGVPPAIAAELTGTEAFRIASS